MFVFRVQKRLPRIQKEEEEEDDDNDEEEKGLP